MSKPLLSIGMIFKNEIRCLERCMKSLQPLRDAVDCELVMADTGSDDGSREIGEKYADIFFDFPWIDDFSAARNAVIDRCSGEWFLSVDADEWLDKDITELTDFLRDRRQWKSYQGCALTIHNYLTLAEKGDVNDFFAVRLVRLSPDMRYEGEIHEHWRDSQLQNIFGLSKTALHHDGYIEFSEEEGRAKRERNMVPLRKALEKDPENLVIVTQCLESSINEEMEHYARMGIKGVEDKWHRWYDFGPPLFRYAVSVAKERKLPELWPWIRQAREIFPKSIFIRLDVSYIAFVDCFEAKNWEQAIQEGETYLQALSDYQTWKFDAKELVFGALVNLAPVRENIVRICLANAYLELGQRQESWETVKEVDPDALALENVSNYVGMLMNIHAQTAHDTGKLMLAAWRSFEDRPDFKREMVVTAVKCLPKAFRMSEAALGYRHACTALVTLSDRCELGRAAQAVSLSEPEEIAAVLKRVEDWEQFSIHALIHALERGVSFPLPGMPLTLEEMDRLASRIARAGNEILELNERSEKAVFGEDIQGLCWARALALSVLDVFPWQTAEGKNADRGLTAVRVFVHVERAFLPACYAPEALCEERLFLLPPMHRFGWHVLRAFRALEAGDKAGCVSSLRASLSAYTEMRPMVEFLLDHIPELQSPPPTSEELLDLADQVRILLAMYPENDPAIAAVKASAAYQKVAYLIEGIPAPVFGGLPQ